MDRVEDKHTNRMTDGYMDRRGARNGWVWLGRAWQGLTEVGRAKQGLTELNEA